MFGKLISIFTILITLCAPILEAHELTYPNENLKIESTSEKAQINKSISSIKSKDCDHCQKDDCSDDDSCCQSFCACISASFLRSNKSTQLTSKPISLKVDWYIFNNYLSPPLDPALKPPLFS